MKTPTFLFLSVALALALASTPNTFGETLQLQVDPVQSGITLSATVEILGTVVPLQQQGPNSLVANYAGTIPVDLTAGNIRFLSGATLQALEPNDWRPGLGGVDGVAKASYGAEASISVFVFSVMAYAASRNVVLDVSSVSLPLAAGKFRGADIVFKFADTANSTLDFQATGFLSAKGTKILSGILTNRVAAVGSFEGPAGDEALTIPVDATFGFEAASDEGIVVIFQLAFEGQIVAKRAVVMEEPRVALARPATPGGPISLNWSKSYKLQRATSFSPVNWTDVVADSPINIPPIQPGEYFRVVKK